jgi:hypothetical protein
VDAAGVRASFADSVNLAWFREITEWFGLRDRCALIYDNGMQTEGIALPELLEIATSADLLVNLSGHLTFAPVLDRVRQKVYVDVDPGFTQFWHCDEATRFQAAGHDLYFTIGENIGSPDCSIPTGGIQWLPIRQPVLLDHWPAAESAGLNRFTTIASWRGAFGPIATGGRTFGLKVHEFRKFSKLPTLARPAFEVALDIHPDDQRDRQALEQNGWHITDPKRLADPSGFRQYIQSSDAEFSAAQGIYVETNSGWFSERSARYLASGRPVLVQETGFSRQLPVGEGLLSFRTLEEAVSAAQSIERNYAAHCQAAREMAEKYFDSDIVLGRFLEQIEMKAAAV